MGFSYNVNVLNQKGSPALYTDTFANRPSPGYTGRLFIANDTSAIYEDTGTAWVLIANVSSGAGTLQQVTTNGNTSNVGISITAGGLSTNSLTDTALTLGSVLFSGAGGLVSQDNSAFFWDDTNNRLGLNTTTPGNTLDVHFAGTASTIGLNNTAGNAATIVFANTGVNKWRIGNTAGNTFDIINVFTATSAISVNIAGNVVTLIGALNGTSSVFSSTITSQTNGSTFGNSAIGGLPLIVKSNAVARAIQLVNTLGGTAQILCGGSASTSFIGFETVATSDAFIIYNDGSNRTNGDIGLQGSVTRNVNFYDSTNNNINAQIQYSEVNSNTGQLLFKTNNAGTSATRLTISNTGAATFTGAINGTSATFTSSVTAKNGTSGIAFTTTNAVDADFTVETVSGGTTKIGTSGNILSINSVGGNVLINQTTGKLLLGKTTSTLSDSKVEANGNFYSSGSASGFFWENRSNAANYYGWYTLAGVIYLFNGITNIASINTSTGVYTPLSDVNKKKDFENSTIGLNAILGLKPTLYRMLDEENTNKHLGFIAQEVKEFIPQAYIENGEEENIFIGLDYQAITSTLVKAMQEQQAIINNLLQRIELLENK